MVEQGYVIAGSPKTVTEGMQNAIEGLRVGHMMVLQQIGSMPKDLTMKNTEMFADQVMPHLKGMWTESEGRGGAPPPIAGLRSAAEKTIALLFTCLTTRQANSLAWRSSSEGAASVASVAVANSIGAGSACWTSSPPKTRPPPSGAGKGAAARPQITGRWAWRAAKGRSRC